MVYGMYYRCASDIVYHTIRSYYQRRTARQRDMLAQTAVRARESEVEGESREVLAVPSISFEPRDTHPYTNRPPPPPHYMVAALAVGGCRVGVHALYAIIIYLRPFYT